MDELFNLYRRCSDSNHLLDEIFKSYKLNNGYKLNKYVEQLIYQQHECTSLYVATAANNTPADKELYEREMLSYKEAIKRAMQLAENEIKELLISGRLLGMGYKSVDDTTLYAIPKNEWCFLTIDYEKSRAFCDGRNYIGVRFISTPDIEKLPANEYELIFRLTNNGRSFKDVAMGNNEPQAETVAANDGKKKASLKNNDQRNEIAKIWMAEENRDLDAMTNKEILEALDTFSRTLKNEDGEQSYRPGLFTSGGENWLNRDHSVIPKRGAGRKPGK